MSIRIGVVVIALLASRLASAQPANDNFANAQMLWGISTAGSNSSATLEGGEPDHYPGVPDGYSVWYWWIAPSSSQADFFAEPDQDSDGNDLFQSTVAIYQGETLQNLTQLFYGDYSVSIIPTPGEKYWIAVGSSSGSGGGFSLSHPPSAPVPASVPAIATLSPGTDSSDGGRRVQFTGSNIRYGSGMTISFGGEAATQIEVLGPESIRCIAPAHLPGVVDVVVTHQDGTQSLLSQSFTYTEIPDPEILSIKPPDAPTTGGTLVFLAADHCWRFPQTTQVLFDGIAATNVIVTKAWDGTYSIRCNVPPHAAGPVDVEVINPDGQSTLYPAAFNYYVKPPTISAVTPNTGSVAGGTAVRVDIQSATVPDTVQVHFGGVAAAAVSAPTQGPGNTVYIYCTSPAHAEGWVDVIASTTEWTASRTNAFAYVAPDNGYLEDVPDEFEDDDQGRDIGLIDGFTESLNNFNELHTFHDAGDIDVIDFEVASTVRYQKVRLVSYAGDGYPTMDIYADGELIVEAAGRGIYIDLASGRAYSLHIRNENPAVFGSDAAYLIYFNNGGVGPTTTGTIPIRVVDSYTSRGVPYTEVYAYPFASPSVRHIQTANFNGETQFTLAEGLYKFGYTSPTGFGPVTEVLATVYSPTNNELVLFINRLTTPQITVTSPAAATQWLYNSSHDILGAATGGLTPTVSIFLMKGGSFYRQLAANYALNAGTLNYQWSLPSDITEGSDYKIRVVDTIYTSLYGESDTFSIGGPIDFTVTGNPSPVDSAARDIQLSVNKSGLGTLEWIAEITEGASWLSVKSGSPGVNSAQFTVHLTANTTLSDRTGKVRVRQTNAAGTPVTKELTITQKGCVGPDPVASVQASDNLNDRIRVTWGAVTGATKYKVLRANGENAPANTAVEMIEVSATTWDDTSAALPAGGGCQPRTLTYYTYYVRAVNDCVASAPSAGDTGHVGGEKVIYQKALPAEISQDDIHIAGPLDPLALRLIDSRPIDPETVWGIVESTNGLIGYVEWHPLTDYDGWVVVHPDPEWEPNTTVTFTAGASTREGEVLESVSAVYHIQGRAIARQKPIDPAVSMVAAPENILGVGASYRLDPDKYFDNPTTIWLPVPHGTDAWDLELSYFVTDGESTGWHKASTVQGFLASPMVQTNTFDEVPHLGFTVSHGGVVQLTRKSLPAPDPSGVSGTDRRGTLLIMTAAIAGIVLAGVWRRMSAKNT